MKERCSELEKGSSHLRHERESLAEEVDRLKGDNMRLDTLNRKINADDQDLKLQEEELRDELSTMT